MGLVAEPGEFRRAVVDEVVRIEAVEEPGGCEADELRAREEVNRCRKLRPQRRPVGRREVARVVDEDVPHAERRDAAMRPGRRGSSVESRPHQGEITSSTPAAAISAICWSRTAGSSLEYG